MPTDGPRFPGTVTTESVGSENANDWTSPGSISADDGTEATITAATYDSPDISFRLKAQNFGFSIPAGATIDGILVEIERRDQNIGAAVDFRVQLLDDAGALVGDNKADTGTDWPTAATIANYGSSSDTWNASPTTTMVNDTDFGVVLSVQATAANTDVFVDFIRMSITYTEPAIIKVVNETVEVAEHVVRIKHNVEILEAVNIVLAETPPIVKVVGESEEIAEALNILRHRIRAINESVEIAEAINRVGGLIRNVNETVESAEVVNIVRGRIKNLAESVEIAEAANIVRGRLKQIDETIEIAEAVIKVLGKVRVTTETVELAEAVNRVLGQVKVINETVEIAEAINRLAGRIRNVNETVELAEALNILRGRIRAINETVEISEATNILRGRLQILNETVEIQEAVNRILGITKVVNESVEIPEAVIKVLGKVKNVNESQQIAEAVNRVGGFVKVVGESVEISEAVNRNLALARVVNESIQVAETALKLRGLTRVIDETVDISEQRNRLANLARNINETINIDEQTNQLRALTRVINETANINEARNVIRGLVRVLNEAINIPETAVIAKGRSVVINEAVQILESVIKKTAVGAVTSIISYSVPGTYRRRAQARTRPARPRRTPQRQYGLKPTYTELKPPSAKELLTTRVRVHVTFYYDIKPPRELQVLQELIQERAAAEARAKQLFVVRSASSQTYQHQSIVSASLTLPFHQEGKLVKTLRASFLHTATVDTIQRTIRYAIRDKAWTKAQFMKMRKARRILEGIIRLDELLDEDDN